MITVHRRGHWSREDVGLTLEPRAFHQLFFTLQLMLLISIALAAKKSFINPGRKELMILLNKEALASDARTLE